MSKRAKILTGILLTTVMLGTGCTMNIESDDISVKTGNTADVENSETDSTDGSADEQSGETEDKDTEDTGAEEAADASDGENGELSEKELSDIEKDLNSMRYNGFMSAEFSSPEHIWWNEVFYNGAGLDDSKYDMDKIEKKYLKETGFEELFGDLTVVEKDQVEEFVKETTGYDYSDMEHPLEWLYLEDEEVYISQHGDTNYIPVICRSGEASGDEYKIRYELGSGEDEEAPELELTMKKDGDNWQFVSNVWNPSDGIEGATKLIYDDVVQKYVAAVTDEWDRDKMADNYIACLDDYISNMKGSKKDLVDRLGFCQTDIDGDGIEELFIGEKSDDIMPICDAYTVKGGELNRLFFASDDEKYYLAKDGTFYCEGTDSEGAEYLVHYKCVGPYKFLEEIDGVKYWENPKDRKADPWYYMENGYWDEESARQITEKKYDSYRDEAADSYEHLDYTPLSEHAAG